ncbi:eukaryotic membrane protein family-domain-containing protein [Sphaerosporella brunnea]|uniref:Eukaryotic membrane protein family-domain-containing protein n=1 Tax=Sphaerosporella brunnea TaxID=1250544 RepID=A0A5J5EG19_9PEZI|nr:eukaryotic membrane protein family-domain-containing protein [Sphaerosporella brunnea]
MIPAADPADRATAPSATITWRQRCFCVSKKRNQPQQQQQQHATTAAAACPRAAFLLQPLLRVDPIADAMTVVEGLGIELGGRNNDGHVYATPPPESSGDNMEQHEKKDKVLLKKVPPERMEEPLPRDTATTPFVLPELSSSVRRSRSNTLTTPPHAATGVRPSVSARTLSTPPSSKRVVTPRRRESAERRRMSPTPTPKRKSSGSTVIHNYGGDASYDSTLGGAGEAEGSRQGSEQTPPPSVLAINPASSSSSFRPMQFQTYLSQALASPAPTAAFCDAPAHGHDEGGISQKAGAVYGKPPNNPDDSAAIAMERIMNFFLLPPKLEGALVFGVLACLDSWLYIFTILPLRFAKAVGVLMQFWRTKIWDYFNYDGNKLRKKQRKSDAPSTGGAGDQEKRRDRDRKKRKERKVSGLNPNHKADIFRGMVLFTSCWFLMRFDASKMYHSIRGQSGIKLYVIYNMLDFADKLCAALGQDILDVLFSREVLDRRPDGRSKIWRPFGFFLLALAYNIIHSLVLFYQVITLNVAVNSYSNALMTLLLSVQFVEIKSTVFKKFEKENLFQLLCADIVERFQLLLMLVIIASRNLVELGVWSLSPSSSGGILPKSFTFFPTWTGQVMGPFFMVIGSEMLVDWLKHAYITKFNNVRPVIYERFLDVQCKDYYSRAFSDQNLTKRLGLPVIPLACLFIRATIQTYHMFLATHVPAPLPPTTSLSETENVTSSSLDGIDTLLRRALGSSSDSSSLLDDFVAATTMWFFLLACFLVFLAVKLLLGVLLLGVAGKRVESLKERERMWIHTGARRSSAFGTITISEQTRGIIYRDDPEEEKMIAERERVGREKEMKAEMDTLESVRRWKMSAKRIW